MVRKPLVIVNGLIEQLQAGDTIQTCDFIGVALSNGEAATNLVIGMPVYCSSFANAKRGQANALATSSIIGLWGDDSTVPTNIGTCIITGMVTAIAAQWDVVTGAVGGLVAGTLYYLDPLTPGMLTATAPSIVGHYVEPIGYALTTTQMRLLIGLPVLL